MQKNSNIKSPGQKAKVVRVVTASQVVPWHLDNTLRRMTVDFEVCVVGDDVSYYQDQYPDVNWVDIELNREIMVLSDLLALFSLCRFFLHYKPDIVHSIMPKAGLLTALAGFICRVPIRIHTFTGQVWATKKGVARFFLITIDKLINSLNTVCLTDSPSQSLFLQQHHITESGRPLPVLGKGSLSGVDTARFSVSSTATAAERLRLDLGLSRQNFVFVFVSRKTRDKGAFDIIAAFSRIVKLHPTCNLLFVGPDDSNGELEQLKATNPDMFHNVLNIGKVDNHELFLAISNVLCLPSYREGFGSIVMDAAALAVPTIGSNIVGLVDSIEDGKTGILFSVGDIDRLVSAMLSAIENPKQVKAMGFAAKQRVNDYFSADILYKTLHDFYMELLLKCRSS